MTEAKYRAACRKLRAAYLALTEAAKAAEFFQAEIIGAATHRMTLVPDSLRVQVCSRCSVHGYYERPEPEHYGTSFSCSHPGVPKYDVRLDLWS